MNAIAHANLPTIHTKSVLTDSRSTVKGKVHPKKKIVSYDFSKL